MKAHNLFGKQGPVSILITLLPNGNFLVQIESICRRQSNVAQILKSVFERVGNSVVERFPAFAPFPKMISKRPGSLFTYHSLIECSRSYSPDFSASRSI